MDFQLEPFLQIIKDYNIDIWPMQIFAYVIGIIAIILSFKTGKHSSKLISAVTAFYWLWTGIVFSLFYWNSNYAPASIFGWIFTVEGILFVYAGVLRSDIIIKYASGYMGVTGIILVLYAMIGYPVLGYFLGHTYPDSFPFGLVPCPVNIFTIGILMLTSNSFPRYLLVIPFLWTIAGIVPVSAGIYEDIGMIAGGITGIYFILRRDSEYRKQAATVSSG
jgi:hypothetical protein